MNLNDKALLVQLSISQWTARKMDKKVTKEIATSHGTTVEAGRYHKSLLIGAEQLGAIHSLTAAIRQEFYRNTLPWGIEGTQMLPTANYLAFMSEFRGKKAEWNRLVTQFVWAYPQLRFNASKALGTLYDINDYPEPEQVQAKFNMDLAVFPVPTTDFRVSIGNEEMTRIHSDIERRVQEAQHNAMQDVWQRLFDRVKHIADKLADPKAIFRDSMIENARELCALLPRLNFADDPHLEEMRQKVEGTLIMHPDMLRNDPDRRRNTADEAKNIMDAMSVFMGGGQ